MRTTIILALIIIVSFGCSKLSDNNSNPTFQNKSGSIEIHSCECTAPYYRYLIVITDNNKKNYFNPVNLPDDYKDKNYNIVFSGNLLNDSSIVYTNTPTDAVIEDFKARNIKLTNIRKASNLILN